MDMKKIFAGLFMGLFLNCIPTMAANQSLEESLAHSIVITHIKSQVNKFLEQQQVDSALFYCDKLILADSTNVDPYLIKTDLLLKLGRFEEAMATNNKALKLNPSDVDAILTKSSILMGMSRHDDALATINDALVKDPKNSRLIINKAVFYDYMHDTVNAIATCEEILKIKDAEKNYRYNAHKIIVGNTPVSSIDNAIKAMVKDMGSDDYSTAVFAVQTYNTHSMYDKAEKYKKTAFKLHEKQKIEDKVMFIDEYSHGYTVVQVYEYFNPKDAGGMAVQYLFRVFLANGSYDWQYNIRVEHVLDITGEYKSQMAVMATQSEDGFRTYWETFSELKSTPYEQWIKFANQIIDGQLKVGSSTLKGKDNKSSTVIIGGDKSSEEQKTMKEVKE